MNETVSILLPTQGKRMAGLMYQVYAVMNQSYKDVVLHILVDADEDTFNRISAQMALIADERIKVYQVPTEYTGRWGHRPNRYAVEHLPLEKWVLLTGDDDSIMPWAVEKLIANSEDVDMVIGKVIAVKRNGDVTRVTLGDNVANSYISGSCCLYKTERIREVGFFDTRYASDWDLIEKMLKFPHKQIETALFVMQTSI